MSIHNKIRITKRIDAIVTEMKAKYPAPATSFSELNKLGESLNKLLNYLSSLDELKPNYTTNEIDKYMQAINLDLDLLKASLDKADYVKLLRAFKVLKTIMKFHPAKYSPFEFVIIWLYELIYFI